MSGHQQDTRKLHFFSTLDETTGSGIQVWEFQFKGQIYIRYSPQMPPPLFFGGGG
jgi:hypothetical protein